MTLIPVSVGEHVSSSISTHCLHCFHLIQAASSGSNGPPFVVLGSNALQWQPYLLNCLSLFMLASNSTMLDTFMKRYHWNICSMPLWLKEPVDLLWSPRRSTIVLISFETRSKIEAAAVRVLKSKIFIFCVQLAVQLTERERKRSLYKMTTCVQVS